MKKAIKIALITLSSILAVVIAVVSFFLWYVFTPEKLTPIVQKQASKYLTCETEIGSVELTFFSTYPNFGLKINQIALINPMKEAPNDTLVGMEELVGIVDFEAWWKRDEIKIKEVILNTGTVNLFYDSLGHSNLDIFPPDTSASTESEPFDVDLENIRFKNINLAYVDQTFPMTAILDHTTGSMKGKLQSDILHGNLKIEESIISLNYDGEQYLKDVATQLDMDFDYWLTYLKMNIGNLAGTLNDMPIKAKGEFEEDTISKDLIFDLAFNLASSPIEKIVPMVPPSYQSYFEGVEATGMLVADGTMKGIMNETAMPLFDIHLLVNDANLKYEGVPMAFHDVSGDVTVVTDAMTDSQTYMKIDRLEAKTDGSSFVVKGLMNQLFSDVYCDFTTNANLTLGEFNAIIPSEYKMKISGKAVGQIKSAFTLTQLEKMQLDKIKLSGAVTLSDFDAQYDTLWANTDRSMIEFSLPNKKPASEQTGFVFANINATNLKAGANENISAHLGKTSISLEASNMMDSTRIPDLIFAFSLDSISGSMDTISFAMSKPQGRMVLKPREGYPTLAQIQLNYSAGNMEARLGNDLATMKSIHIDANVVNNDNEKDIFFQWLTKGFVEMDQAYIVTKSLNYPLEIPSIKMDFDPENFNIKESSLKIDKSDFQLSGKLTNILSYFRRDSILRGNFNFTSNNTDVNQLMALTSGIGDEEAKPDSTAADTSNTGPYMVPKGIDFTLSTNIKNASFGTGTASNIKGDVKVHDGILVLDDLHLTTPATRIQLTAMYKTPRKNHLYLGLDYHMLDIEIEKLLTMVPDVDSLMPMLRSFRGKGEFHMAAETYLDSMYNVKMSTLRGAASITGTDLVLLDGETFSEIAKTLNFKKKTENKVDSLSAEFTVFKNEIDVYPFLIVMDKYKAVVAGRHNLDMSFNYHISVVECPLPVKLGIDVKGTLDNLNYKLAPCRYAEGYRPFARHSVETKQLELRKMIRESLVQRVKPDEL